MREVSHSPNGRLLLASAIIFMASSSGEISKEQWGQLKSVVGADDELLKEALGWWVRGNHLALMKW